MPARRFHYDARDADGVHASGDISARDRVRAAAKLARRGLFTVGIEEPTHEPRWKPAAPRATRPELAAQVWQLAIMVDSGLGLADALDCLAMQARGQRLRALLTEIAASVQSGHPLSESLRRFPKSFPPALIAMIEASELSGTLAATLRQSAAYLAKDLQVTRKMRTALAYPACMLVACAGVVVFLVAFVLPRFAAVFAAQRAILPAPTRALLALSGAVRDHWAPLATAAALVAAVGWTWARSQHGRRAIDRLLVTGPVVGPVFNAFHQGRSFRTLAVLTESRAPLLESVRIIRDLVPNTLYRELWADVQEQLIVGEPMAGPLMEAPFIEPSTAQMIANGDRAGQLRQVFLRLAEYMEERYDRAIAATMQLLEPAMILLVGAIVGFVAVAMMLPLFNAAGVMSR